ncbi:MAG: class I SAM-dependent methyltransferase [Bacteroidetes bacterium]|nr:class I SAM-dependent methyltransferase [Bacteroidota bacterium]
MIKEIDSHTEIKLFFEQWKLYQKIIKHNYMKHKEIATALDTSLLSSKHDGIKILDVGCGDAEVISKVIKAKDIKEYMGIDLTELALQYAKKNMEDIECEKKFLRDDFLQKMQHLQLESKKFDYIIAGYSLHHLTITQKENFFRLAKNLVEEGGQLIIYDLILKKNEKKKAYVERFFDICKKEWCLLEENELKSVFEHVLKNDILETKKSLEDMGEKHGFCNLEVKFNDYNKFYGFLSFRKLVF